MRKVQRAYSNVISNFVTEFRFVDTFSDSYNFPGTFVTESIRHRKFVDTTTLILGSYSRSGESAAVREKFLKEVPLTGIDEVDSRNDSKVSV